MKECRDAHRPLAAEGIAEPAERQLRIVRALGLPVPNKGEFVSTRIVPTPTGDNRPAALIDGLHYVAARHDEPCLPAPLIHY